MIIQPLIFQASRLWVTKDAAKKFFSFTGVGCLSWLIQNVWKSHSETWFPPEKIPPLPPLSGNVLIGYMGCPKSKIEEIQKKKRLLFFSGELSVPQEYALSRTSLIQRLLGKDQPVVLQIEATKQIQKNELWQDPLLHEPPTSYSRFISFFPAIPPKIQEECNVQVRIHHEVSRHNLQKNGALSRAIECSFVRLSKFCILSETDVVSYPFFP